MPRKTKKARKGDFVTPQEVEQLKSRGHDLDLPLHLVVSDDWERLTQRVRALEDKLESLIEDFAEVNISFHDDVDSQIEEWMRKRFGSCQ